MVSTSSFLKEKICLSIKFLEATRSQDGLWYDFLTLAGSSSEWVTGFVLYALGQCQQFPLSSCLISLKALLALQRRNGGLAYNQDVPTDSDSTSWCYLALSTFPLWRPSAMIRASAFLRRHHEQTTGGFMTYNSQDAIHRYIEVENSQMVQGWTSSHPSVTATVLQCLLLQGERPDSERVQSSINYLLQEQNQTGLWQCYWWKDYAYPTYQALRALFMVRAVKTLNIVAIGKTIIGLQNADGGWSSESGGESAPFVTAFNILTLLLFCSPATLTAAQRGVEWLLASQETNGRWAPVPVLRIPPPMIRQVEVVEKWDINNLGTAVIIEDQQGIFTTASVIWALSIYRGIIC